MTNQVIVKKPSRMAKFAYVAPLALFATGAFANGPATPDLTPIVTMINGLVAVVASVGMAVLTVYATGKVFKWVRTAF